MKIRTLDEARKSIANAQIDLKRVHWARDLRDAPGQYQLIDRQDLLKFYISQWSELGSDPEHRQKWSDQLDILIESIEKYIPEVEEWMRRKLISKRSCVPLKKQREQGLLPSVEAQRQLQGRP